MAGAIRRMVCALLSEITHSQVAECYNGSPCAIFSGHVADRRGCFTLPGFSYHWTQTMFVPISAGLSDSTWPFFQSWCPLLWIPVTRIGSRRCCSWKDLPQMQPLRRGLSEQEDCYTTPAGIAGSSSCADSCGAVGLHLQVAPSASLMQVVSWNSAQGWIACGGRSIT